MIGRFNRFGLALGAAVFVAMLLAVAVWAAAAADIDQCANGTFASPQQCAGAQWQNGNVNENNSHYREGDTVPFRIKLTGLTAGTTYSVTIQWQYLNSGKHAYDYITSYNASETTADPCSNAGFVCSAPTSTFPIPADPTLASCTGFTGTQVPGVFTLFGGTITSLSAYGTTTCGTGNQFQSITINFTASAADEVLAWGGHIASDFDWGPNTGAEAISGSPYHMAQQSCSFGCGAQDRSLKASGVILPPAISTQRSGPNSSMQPGTQVSDTVVMTGTTGPISGTVSFFLCSNAPNHTPPNCTTGGSAVGGPTTVQQSQTGSGNNITYFGRASSINVQPLDPGTYCFRVEFTPAANSQYAFAKHTNTITLGGGAECFDLSGPTAVTVNTFDANQQGYALVAANELAVLGLGIAGVLTLGLVALVVMRRK